MEDVMQVFLGIAAILQGGFFLLNIFGGDIENAEHNIVVMLLLLVLAKQHEVK